MNKNLRHQAGMSGIGLMFLFVLIAFVVMFGLKLAPIYIDNYKLASVLKSIDNEPGVGSKSATEIMSLIGKRLSINDIDSVSTKDFNIKSKGANRIIDVKYEVRTPLMGNVDLVVNFADNSVEVPGH